MALIHIYIPTLLIEVAALPSLVNIHRTATLTARDMAAIPLVSADLATIFLESFLYGIFFVLGLSSVYLLASRQKHLLQGGRSQAPFFSTVIKQLCKSPMFVGAISLFVTITAVGSLTIICLKY